MRVSPEELGNPAVVSVPEMGVTGEKKAVRQLLSLGFLTFKEFYEFKDLEGLSPASLPHPKLNVVF